MWSLTVGERFEGLASLDVMPMRERIGNKCSSWRLLNDRWERPVNTIREEACQLWTLADVWTRSSATAERQRVSYTRLSRLTHWSCTSLSTAPVLQLYNRLAKIVSTLAANKPCGIRTLSWIGHSRSFKVILIGAGRNPEWSVVVMCN